MESIFKWFSDQDWVAILAVIKDIVTIGSLAIGAVIAYSGLKTWKKQLIGRTEYDLARNLLSGILKIRDEIGFVRNPFMSSGEIASAVEKHEIKIEHDHPEFQGQSSRAVWFIRMERLLQAHNDLRAFRLQAEALWGQEFENLMKELDNQIAKLQTAIDLYSRAMIRGREHDENMIDFEKTVYALSGAKDKYSLELQAIIASLETEIKPHLEL